MTNKTMMLIFPRLLFAWLLKAGGAAPRRRGRKLKAQQLRSRVSSRRLRGVCCGAGALLGLRSLPVPLRARHCGAADKPRALSASSQSRAFPGLTCEAGDPPSPAGSAPCAGSCGSLGRRRFGLALG